MVILALGLAPFGASKGQSLSQKGRTIMGLIEALLAGGLLTTAYFLLFTAAR
jgi:hypothetical protein